MKTKKITMLSSARLLRKKFSMEKKSKVFKLTSLVVIFGAVFFVTHIIKAGTSQNLNGWVWGGSDDGNATGLGVISSGLGGISMNSSNCDSDSNNFIDVVCGGLNTAATPVLDYGVNIPLSDGAVTGYAWSANAGPIDFDPQDHCGGAYPAASCAAPDGTSGNGGVSRYGNNLVGWARITDIARASAVGNSSGWSGWIKLSGVAQNNTDYGVKIDNASGEASGYAWSDEFGYISFKGVALDSSAYGAKYPKTPIITLSATPFTLNLETNSVLPQTVTLNWTVSNATTCVKSSTNGLWTSGSIPAVNGSDNVNQSNPSADYTLTCTGSGGTVSKKVTVSTMCNKKACSATQCTATAQYGIAAINSPSCAKSCSTDADCSSGGGTGWHEIVPEN